MSAEVQAMAEASGGRIQNLGAKSYDDLPAAFADADLYWQPSSRDTWALSVNEAMASGLPILVSEMCGCHEDLVTIHTGWRFNPFSEQSMIQALEAAANRHDEWPLLGDGAAAHIDLWGLPRFCSGAFGCGANRGNNTRRQSMNGSMRILHVVPSLDPARGGTSSSLLGLVRAEAALGADVHVVSGRNGDTQRTHGNHIGVDQGQCLPLPFCIPGPDLWRIMASAINAAELIHLHTVWTGTITAAAWLCRYYRKPMLLTPHGMLDRHNMQRRARFKKVYLQAVEQDNLAAMAGFHFLDESEREGCDWLRPTRHTPYAVQSNGLDLRAINGRLTALPIGVVKAAVPDTDATHLVFLGRLNEIKGLELQIEILADLRAAGLPAHLHLIGPDDGEGAKLDALAASLGVAAAMHRHGPVYGDERLRWLEEADAVMLTSHYECNSMTAGETLAVGGVLVATDTCHLDKAAQAGAARVVARSREPLRDALLEVLIQSRQSARQRAAAKDFAARQLDWAVLAARMLQFYASLIERHEERNPRPVR